MMNQKRNSIMLLVDLSMLVKLEEKKNGLRMIFTFGFAVN